MHANARQPITLEDLVAVSGLPGRTLFRSFRLATGLGPMRYLRGVRFEGARAELAENASGVQVGDVARAWGFKALGRFAVEYRRRFGEPPSATRRQCD